jgi:hypothetical protein
MIGGINPLSQIAQGVPLGRLTAYNAFKSLHELMRRYGATDALVQRPVSGPTSTIPYLLTWRQIGKQHHAYVSTPSDPTWLRGFEVRLKILASVKPGGATHV